MARKFNFNVPDNENKSINENIKEENVIVEAPKSQSTVQSLIEEIDTPINTAFNFKYIKREKMVFHKNNDYPMESVEYLAGTILDLGLIHNIEVYYDVDNDLYVIDSGEQRTRAIDLLINKYKNLKDDSEDYKKYLRNVQPFENGYPCNVKIKNNNNLPDDDADLVEQLNAEIRLIIANESGRDKDPAATKKHIDKLHQLYTQRNSTLKRENKINVNEQVAIDMGISSRQTKKYRSINKLIPELQAKFDESAISLSDGANYASLTEEEQKQILVLIEKGESKKEVAKLYEQMNKLKADIDAKNQAIEKLETAQTKALQLMEETKEKSKELKEQIKKELEANDPNKNKIEELQNKLDEATTESKEQKKTLKITLNEKDQMIAALEKKLAIKEGNDFFDTELVRNESQLDNSLTELEQQFKSFTDNLKNYKIMYKENSKTKTPEQYENDIKQFIDKCRKKIK